MGVLATDASLIGSPLPQVLESELSNILTNGLVDNAPTLPGSILLDSLLKDELSNNISVTIHDPSHYCTRLGNLGGRHLQLVDVGSPNTALGRIKVALISIGT